MRSDYFAGQCCIDCLHLLANGTEPEEWSEGVRVAWRLRIQRETTGYTVTLGHVHEDPHCTHPGRPCPDNVDCDCDLYGFRTTSCDHCGSAEAGDRYAVTFWPIGQTPREETL